MNSQYRRLISVVVVLLMAGLSLTEAASATETDAPSTTVNQLLPGSTVSTETNGSTQQLSIQLPVSAVSGAQTEIEQEFGFEEIGWRARIAAAIVFANNPTIASYQVTTAAGQVPADAFNEFHGGFVTFGTPITDPNLDSLSPNQAMQQLDSNLSVLASALPEGTIVSDSPILIPANSSNPDQFALEVDITIANSSSSSSLSEYFGDVLQGLQTGLTGDPTTSPIEGLAIVVTADDGTPIVGSWISTRSANGTVQFADPSQAVTGMQVTTQFPDLTGGPPTFVGVLGSPAKLSKSSHGKVGIALATPARIHGSSQPGWTFLVLCIGLLCVALALLARRRRIRV